MEAFVGRPSDIRKGDIVFWEEVGYGMRCEQVRDVYTEGGINYVVNEDNEINTYQDVGIVRSKN